MKRRALDRALQCLRIHKPNAVLSALSMARVAKNTRRKNSGKKEKASKAASAVHRSAAVKSTTRRSDQRAARSRDPVKKTIKGPKKNKEEQEDLGVVSSSSASSESDDASTDNDERTNKKLRSPSGAVSSSTCTIPDTERHVQRDVSVSDAQVSVEQESLSAESTEQCDQNMSDNSVEQDVSKVSPPAPETSESGEL